MDSLTQVVLGAAVGHATAGERLGRKAAAVGCLAGTLPDLDVLAYPFLDPASELLFHRGLTHGLAFGLVAGTALGWLSWRIATWRAPAGPAAASPRPWILLWVLVLVTHSLLDAFTVYGTQLLAPFSNHPFAVSSVFIIDPLYTVPLLACLVVALLRKAPRWAAVGLAISTVYLGWGVAAQAHVRGTVQDALAERGMPPERLLVAAGPLTSLWWRGIAEHDGQIWPVSVHLLDPPRDVEIGEPLAPADLPPAAAESRTGQTLRWFSRDWLVRLDEVGNTVRVADPRFGRAGEGTEAPFVFTWAVSTEPPYAFRQLPLATSLDAEVFREIFRRYRFTRPDPAGDLARSTSDPSRSSTP
ncbi:MAG: metal-dependent hydrolase [Bacteroidota bacterium]